MEPQKEIPQFWMTLNDFTKKRGEIRQQSAVETGVGAGISYQAPPDPAESYELKPRPIGASVRFTLFHRFIANNSNYMK